MAATDARPIPIKNTAFRAVFPILDADGDLVTGATALDSEVSKDQGTFADCTNEATEIATNSGIYYLDLTATEMNADCVAVIVKTTSTGAKTTVLVLYPEETGDINVDVTAWLGTAAATPTVAGVPEVDVTHWIGTAAATPTVAGVPEVDLTHVAGSTTSVSALASGVATLLADWINGGRLDLLIDAIKAQTDLLPSDPADASVVAGLIDTVDNFVDTEIQTIITMLTGIVPVNGTIGATGNSTTTLHLSGVAWTDNGPNSMLLTIKDVSTGLFYSRWIEDWADTGDLATVATLPFTPEASVDLYWLIPVRADVTGGSGLDAAGVRAAIGLAAANLDTQLAAIDDYIDAEITAIDDLLDTEVAAIKAVVDSNATKLDTIDGFLDTEIAAIKAKTDNLPAAPAATGDIPSVASIVAGVWDEPTAGNTTAGTFGERVTRIPNAAAGGNGGLPTVDANNYVAGIQGTLNQLDDLNNLSAAQVNAEVDTALDTAVPGSPTSGSINERIKTMDDADIPGRLPAALSGGKMDSVADVTAISGDTTAADKLEAALDGTVTATVNDAGATTTAFITTLTSAVDDFYNGRIITFNTGALAGQQREITDYVGATKTVTVAALTSAPANGVAFTVT